MILLLLIFIAFVTYMSIRENARLSEMEESLQTKIVPVRKCPPHKWQYVEVKDTEGNTVKWNIVCDHCGPLQSQGKPAGGDYS